MNQQVITIAPDGALSGLQRKRGRGVDLRQFGHAAIERASEITWNEEQQCWHVHVLNHAAVRWMGRVMGMEHLGMTLMAIHWIKVMPEDVDGDEPGRPNGAYVIADGWLSFDDYDDAVAAEVAFLDALRLKGVF